MTNYIDDCQLTVELALDSNGAFDTAAVSLGRVGDHNHTILKIDVGDWVTEGLSDTLFDLYITRDGSAARRVLTDTSADADDTIYYEVSGADTEYSGKGTISVVAHTDMGVTMVSAKTAYTVADGVETDHDLSAIAAKAGLMVIHFTAEGSLDNWGDKTDIRTAYMELFDYDTGIQVATYVKLKPQGTSSLAYPKKNFTVQCFTDDTGTTSNKVTVRQEWKKQSKYCLKANYIDPTQSCNVVSARLAAQSLSDVAAMADAPNHGLINGYPALVFLNDDCTGLYTMNIPKEAWMFDMDTSNLNHIVLCAEDQLTEGAFKAAATSAGWSIEVGSDTETTIYQKFNRVVSFVKDSEIATFKSNFSQYLDLDAALNYYAFAMITGATDNLGKNMLMVTKDGTNWVTSLYDMDSLFGIQWNGIALLPSNASCPEAYQCNDSLLWEKLEQAFFDELYARYVKLRQGALSDENMINEFTSFINRIPDKLFEYDALRWLGTRKMRRSLSQMEEFITERGEYLDELMLKKYNIRHSIATIEYELPSAFVSTTAEEKYVDTEIIPFTQYADSFTLLCRVNSASDGAVIFSSFSERYPDPGYIGMLCRVFQDGSVLKMGIQVNSATGYAGCDLTDELEEEHVDIAIVNNLGKFTVYVNNVAKSSAIVTGLEAVTESLLIGAEHDVDGTPFRFGTMNIPMFRFYSGVMSSAEIAAAFEEV